MSLEEKAKYIDHFILELSKAAFASPSSIIFELENIPSPENKEKFKVLEDDLINLGLVVIRNQDNPMYDYQREFEISQKGEELVSSGKSSIDLLKIIYSSKTEMKINWTQAYNKLWKLIDGPARMTGPAFIKLAREIDDSIPKYNQFIEDRRERSISTSRQDFFEDIINDMSEEMKFEFYDTIIKELEAKLSPEQISDLKGLFNGAEQIIKKKVIPKAIFNDETYKDVIETINYCFHSAEQKPSLYSGKDEEGLRDFCLAFLESRYVGAVSSGETFNKLGKTDIIIKIDSGQNLFVAECKFWHGAEEFHKIIDQLMGYLTWHDTKSSIIIFSKNAKFTEVLRKIKEETEKNKYFKRHVFDRSENSFAYIFKHSEDDEREIKLEIMAFNFPE